MERTSCGAGALARVIEVESRQLAIRVPHEFVADLLDIAGNRYSPKPDWKPWICRA